jgi:hypothetical protein
MGFRGLVPAEELAAFYNASLQTLTLFASGEVQKYTYGINFIRDPHWVGGLKFELYGWTGPLSVGFEKYSCDTSVSIQLPSPVIPEAEVVIVTQNYPDGQVIPIEGLPNRDKSLSVSKSPPSSQPVNRLESGTQINALYREPFEIKQAAKVPKFGTIDIAFDPTFLTITNAGIDDGNIVWTFNSLQTGNTQAVVTVHGGVQAFIIRKTYDIRIFVLDATPNPTDEILSYLGRVNIAVRIVTEKYPDAELYEVDATLPRGDPSPTSSPLGLSQLRAVFRAKGGTVIILSTGWGEWAQPQFVPSPWLECVVIPWPIKMDITDAAAILRNAGYKDNIWNCTLRHPLGPGGKPYDEPYYIFLLAESREYVFVGVNDGKIYVNKAGQDVLPKRLEDVRA